MLIIFRGLIFRGLIFRVFDWRENSWGINFRGHGSMVGTMVVGFAKYASYCGLIFVGKRHTTKSAKIIHLKNFYTYSNCFTFWLSAALLAKSACRWPG